MLRFRRVRTAAPVGAFAVALGLVTGPADPVAEAAPRSFTIVGGGYGHGIGMSRYGAHGMALRGASAGRIIPFYHGGSSTGGYSGRRLAGQQRQRAAGVGLAKQTPGTPVVGDWDNGP
jgi:hypothetical protein